MSSCDKTSKHQEKKNKKNEKKQKFKTSVHFICQMKKENNMYGTQYFQTKRHKKRRMKKKKLFMGNLFSLSHFLSFRSVCSIQESKRRKNKTRNNINKEKKIMRCFEKSYVSRRIILSKVSKICFHPKTQQQQMNERKAKKKNNQKFYLRWHAMLTIIKI